MIKFIKMNVLRPKTENRKWDSDTTNGSAGSESKQNKGVREGFFGPGIQLSALFPLLAPETQNTAKGPRNH